MAILSDPEWVYRWFLREYIGKIYFQRRRKWIPKAVPVKKLLPQQREGGGAAEVGLPWLPAFMFWNL